MAEYCCGRCGSSFVYGRDACNGCGATFLYGATREEAIEAGKKNGAIWGGPLLLIGVIAGVDYFIYALMAFFPVFGTAAWLGCEKYRKKLIDRVRVVGVDDLGGYVRECEILDRG
nr:hypothetical protein [Pseudomonas sp. A46]